MLIFLVHSYPTQEILEEMIVKEPIWTNHDNQCHGQNWYTNDGEKKLTNIFQNVYKSSIPKIFYMERHFNLP